MIKKSRHYLGQVINKTCPWCKTEFSTDNARDVYDTRQCNMAAKQARYRARKYAERDELPVSSTPGASYNLRIRERLEEPVTLTSGHKTEVDWYAKAPVKSSADYELRTDLINWPDMSEAGCRHGEVGYCWKCDLG